MRDRLCLLPSVSTPDGHFALPTNLSKTLDIRVRSIMNLALDINALELVDPNGAPLPEFTAGAHIDIHLGEGLIRQYSLCNDPADTHRYVIAVLREQNGAGGSVAVHDQIKAGQILKISAPRNNFPLVVSARRHLFLAGGIGITPIRAMIQECRNRQEAFELVYCTRSTERTAFLEELGKMDEVTIHHDGGDPTKSFDLTERLREVQLDTHIYYCGPPGFMRAAETAAAHWPTANRHFEYFIAPKADPVSPENDALNSSGAFQVKINSSGAIYDVPEDKSIVEVLRENGIFVETSCEAGLCGTCLTHYLEGVPEHHDLILDDEQRSTQVLICCARALSPLIVLDL